MTTRLEQRIFRDLLADKLSLEAAQTAMADPQAWKTQRRGMTYMGEDNYNRSYLRGVQTPRLFVEYSWYKHRNAAGYFVGWRQTTNSQGVKKIDQVIARRSKKRLVEFFRKKTEALRAKYPPAQKPKREKRTKPLDPRIENIEGSTGDWFIHLKYGYKHHYGHYIMLEDLRSLPRLMGEVTSCQCGDCN